MSSRSEQQQQLGLGDVARRTRRGDDYVGVFARGVMPTTIGAVECGGHMLYIKNLKHKQTIPPAQDRLFKVMTQFDTPDAPGSVTVLVVWGNPITAPRTCVRYDRFGKHNPQNYTNEEYTAVLQQWWNEHKARR